MAQKIGRNAPCPCGSGLKFKKCCGNREPPPIPSSDLQVLRQDPRFGPVLDEINLKRNPQGRPVPSIEHKGHRYRAVGNRVYPRPLKETFHEFLINLLKSTLGRKWHEEQLNLPPEERHQIFKWYKANADFVKAVVENPLYKEGERYGAEPTGEVQALMTLAYDVFHLLHRDDLPNELLRRLKDKTGFQGARYEIAVAAIFVRAGCEVNFIRDKSKKHCEFAAHDRTTGSTVAVESKSRHRPGALDFPGEPDRSKAIRGDVEGLINQALEQNPGDGPFMIFVDLNVPLDPGAPVQERPWFKDVWTFMQSLTPATKDTPDEFNTIYLTNFSYHWQGSEKASAAERLFVHSAFPKYPIPPELVGHISGAVTSYGSIPKEI